MYCSPFINKNEVIQGEDANGGRDNAAKVEKSFLKI